MGPHRAPGPEFANESIAGQTPVTHTLTARGNFQTFNQARVQE